MHFQNAPGALHRFFTGLAQHAFEARLGIADPPLVDYIAELLVRFARADAIHGVRGLNGARLAYVADMLVEAENRIGEARRAVHRHIGDFTLFWSGLYPEALKRYERSTGRDFLLDYREHGKRAYYIASTIPTEQNARENEVLERLSHEFELCTYGLGEIRREWERLDDEEDRPAGPFLIN